MHLATVVCCYYAVSQLTVTTFLATWRRLLPDFGRMIQEEEEKERRTWNNQVSFALFFYIATFCSAARPPCFFFWNTSRSLAQ